MSTRAIADTSAGIVLATVDILVPPERVFQALTTDELTKWWGADGLYRTTKHVADLRPGGAWRSSGVGADGHEFSVGGEFLEVDPPNRIVQTWAPDWDAGAVTTVTYRLQAIAGGTRLTVRHEGFGDRAASCEGHAQGWERVGDWLATHLVPATKYFFARLVPPRPDFPFTLSPEERELMGAHGAYLRANLDDVVVAGPVHDPAGPWGMIVVRAADQAAMDAFAAADPVVRSGRGFRYEAFPMLSVVLGR
ncbi:MAG TPA: SRPBCC domain-containing protein [Kofleriaceae bacterium]|jgi:uncharacterized protein YndB with AHSA1/START domain